MSEKKLNAKMAGALGHGYDWTLDPQTTQQRKPMARQDAWGDELSYFSGILWPWLLCRIPTQIWKT
jgi:hypothetical protein